MCSSEASRFQYSDEVLTATMRGTPPLALAGQQGLVVEGGRKAKLGILITEGWA